MIDDVARYYDSNTRRFLALGGGASSLSIHRALWGPGVEDSAAAVSHINVLIGEAIESIACRPNAVIADLGCGVGGTLFALAARFPDAELHGITISPRQAELAEQFADRRDLGSRCRFRCADFASCQLGVGVDVAVAIESMAHAVSLAAALGNAARLIEPGGTLLVVDDFIVSDASTADDERIYTDFRNGWHLPSLTTVTGFAEVAAAAGLELVERRDLTPLIRLDRSRDRVIGTIGPLLRPFVAIPVVANFVGGAALTRGMRRSILTYQWLRFEQRAEQLPDSA